MCTSRRQPVRLAIAVPSFSFWPPLRLKNPRFRWFPTGFLRKWNPRPASGTAFTSVRISMSVCDMLLAFYNRITNRKVPFLSMLLRPPSTESQVRIFGMRLGTKCYCVFNVPSCPPHTPQILPAERRWQAGSAAHTKVILQSRQFSASSSTDAVPATTYAHGGSQRAAPGTKSAHGGSQSAAPATKSAHGGSHSAVPATKSAHGGSQSAAPGTKSAHGGSHSAVPATKSAHGGSQSAAPATKSTHGGSQSAAPATKSAHGGSQSTAPATQTAPVPSRRQTTPGRTSDPLASSKVLRLPRNLRPCPADARRRQGVHPTPWRAAKCCTCHEICAGAQPTPDDARAYIRPLGAQQSTAPATQTAPVPSRRQTTPRRTSDPLASSKVLRLPRKLRRCPADARRRQGVHPTPWQAPTYCACHEICAGAQPTPCDARAYIRPLGKQQSAVPATQTAPVPRRRQTTPGRTTDPLASNKALCLPRDLRRCPADARRRQGVHPTIWQAAKCCACHKICAGGQPTPDDARAYIRPLGKQQSAAPATKSAPVPSRRQTTPGCTSDPLASSKVLRLPRNLRRCPADARRRQGVHPTPRQAPTYCACHALRPCPADARRRQGVHPTPWQAAKCCACHEMCAGAQTTPDDARAYIRPLGKQQSAVPATRSAHGGSQRLPRNLHAVVCETLCIRCCVSAVVCCVWDVL